jgi:alpha-L-fucosidase
MACTGEKTSEKPSPDQRPKYIEEWHSLYEHNEAPEWFRDSKLGIYFHWGVYSVPAFGSEWYPRNMHIKESKVHQHHVQTYGNPDEFGYHDFVPMFTAENFDAEEWAVLFRKAGAKFAGPVAEHHDGFSMWASKQNPWNAQDIGPKRDIVGEMEKAIRNHGMRFITSFHHAFNNQHPIEKFPTGYYPHIEGWPTASDDPNLRLLYGNLPRAEFLQLWKGKLLEVIDGYRPDIIWFDFVLGDIPEESRKEFLAYYFNKAKEWDKEVVVTFKQEDLPREVGVEDFEKGRLDRLTEYPWMTDDTISWGSWCFTENLEIKSIETVLHTFIDIVSKNGVLLLNISPMSDGTIPDDQKKVLIELGNWLERNGEAIYATRPWKTFGEGPTRMKKSGAFVGRVDYTPYDIRFTQSKDGNAFYAIVLGLPQRDIQLEVLKVNGVADDAQIRLLSNQENVTYRINNDGTLTIQPPKLRPGQTIGEYAVVFKLTGFELELNS